LFVSYFEFSQSESRPHPRVYDLALFLKFCSEIPSVSRENGNGVFDGILREEECDGMRKLATLLIVRGNKFGE